MLKFSATFLKSVVLFWLKYVAWKPRAKLSVTRIKLYSEYSLTDSALPCSAQALSWSFLLPSTTSGFGKLSVMIIACVQAKDCWFSLSCKDAAWQTWQILWQLGLFCYLNGFNSQWKVTSPLNLTFFFSMQQWTLVMKKKGRIYFWIRNNIMWNMKPSSFCFMLFFFFKNGTWFSAQQYRKASLIMLRKIIMKESNMDLWNWGIYVLMLHFFLC